MPVCGNYLFFELPKKIVLNPKDGADNKIPFFFDKNDHSQKFPNKNVFTK